MLFESLILPLPQVTKNNLFLMTKRKTFTIELTWLEFNFLWLSSKILRWEYGPTGVKEDVSCELSLSLILRDYSSMHSNNITNPLADWKIFESVCKQNQCEMINDSSLSIDIAAPICNF